MIKTLIILYAIDSEFEEQGKILWVGWLSDDEPQFEVPINVGRIEKLCDCQNEYSSLITNRDCWKVIDNNLVKIFEDPKNDIIH